MEEWINLISNVGFPIAITFWFMYRMEKIIRANTEAMTDIRIILSNLQR